VIRSIVTAIPAALVDFIERHSLALMHCAISTQQRP